MPYRRLPNTDAARLRALKKALEKGKETPPFHMAFSQKNLVRLEGFLPHFIHNISLRQQVMSSQSDKSKEYQDTARKARMYISHFLRVMNMAIIRGELQPETRTYFNIPVDDPTVPSIATENELLSWGKRVIDGEDIRKKRGLTPITNPSIAVVKVWYDQFVDIHRFQKNLDRRSSDYANKTASLRKEANDLISDIWNDVESSLSGLPEEKRRREAEKYGLVYVFRKNELVRE